MNPKWFGDSYDIVKRFFATALQHLGYDVYIDPMLTGEWEEEEEELYHFLRMRPVGEYREGESALFLDPDIGIRSNVSPKHTTISRIADLLKTHEIVYSFDQSFSRGVDPLLQMQTKLAALSELGAAGFYFDSHARFLFASVQTERLDIIRKHFEYMGLPSSRFVCRLL